jgi:HSP20 family protein
MAVFHWGQGWEPLRDLEQQVDQLLEGFRIPFRTVRLERQFPPLNLYELDEEFLLTAELPGMSSDKLEVTVRGGIMTLRGERSGPADIKEEQFRRHERSWGPWERSFGVPDRVDTERVSAELNDGILKVHLPKLPESPPRQIAVVQGDRS